MRPVPKADISNTLRNGEVCTVTNEELVAMIQRGDRNKLVELWEQVKGLVWKQAHRWAAWRLGGAEVEDLVQAGFIAVLRAADTFDSSVGAKFTTHLDAYLKAEFAFATGQKTSRTRNDLLQTAYSFDTPLTDDKRDICTLADLIADPIAAAQLESVEKRDWLKRLHIALEKVLCTLTVEERRTVCARYCQGKTLATIATEEGVHKSTVCMWEQRAIRCLRHPSRSKELLGFLYS